MLLQKPIPVTVKLYCLKATNSLFNSYRFPACKQWKFNFKIYSSYFCFQSFLFSFFTNLFHLSSTKRVKYKNEKNWKKKKNATYVWDILLKKKNIKSPIVKVLHNNSNDKKKKTDLSIFFSCFKSKTMVYVESVKKKPNCHL